MGKSKSVPISEQIRLSTLYYKDAAAYLLDRFTREGSLGSADVGA
jgi:hypothetical protein